MCSLFVWISSRLLSTQKTQFLALGFSPATQRDLSLFQITIHSTDSIYEQEYHEQHGLGGALYIYTINIYIYFEEHDKKNKERATDKHGKGATKKNGVAFQLDWVFVVVATRRSLFLARCLCVALCSGKIAQRSGS